MLVVKGGQGVLWNRIEQPHVCRNGKRRGEPQQIVPVRLSRAEAHWLAGNRPAAMREAASSTSITRTGASFEMTPSTADSSTSPAVSVRFDVD